MLFFILALLGIPLPNAITCQSNSEMSRQRTAHAAKPRTKWMKNGILGLRSKAGGRFAIKSASLERGQATFEHTELRFDRVH